MSHTTMTATTRGTATKSDRQRLRREGYIVANVHGHGPSTNLALEYKPWFLLLRKGSSYLTIQLTITDEGGKTGGEELVQVADVLWSPLHDKIRHVDFRRISKVEEEALMAEQKLHAAEEEAVMESIMKKVHHSQDIAKAEEAAAAAAAEAAAKAAAKPAKPAAPK